MEDKYVVGFGEVLWDMLPEGKKLGGAPANFAYHAGQHGLKSVVVSALGNDASGNEIVSQLEAKHLDSLMPRVPYPTGTVRIELDREGVPSYNIMENVAWDNIPCTDRLLELAGNTHAVCWGMLAQRNNVSRETICRFLASVPNDCLKVFDINLRQSFYTKEIICDSLKCCNILKINAEELDIVSRLVGCHDLDVESRCRFILGRYSLDILVLTYGVNGSYVFTPSMVSFLETPKVEVADTVGAGDSFTGTFCAGILKGKTVQEAHRQAVRVSAYVCTQNGSMPQIPYELKY